MVGIYSALFQYLMRLENQEHSWITAVYWCLVVMSTLGFGDIIFTSDLGRAFSVVVLLSGTIFMLVLLPFFFIQFFFIPWMENQASSRAKRKLPANLSGHVLLTGLGPIEFSLISKLETFKVPYAILIHEINEALSLGDQGYQVMHGAIDDPQTYRNARAEHAALIATTREDTINSNVAFTVREVAEQVPIVATSSSSASVDILKLAGCDRVLELGKILGESFGRRILGTDGKAHVIGELGELRIAEALVAHPALISKKLSEINLREKTNVTIVGTWDRGTFELAGPNTVLNNSSVIILAGSQDQLEQFNAHFSVENKKTPFVLILGRGRVGKSLEETLLKKEIDYRIIDKRIEKIQSNSKHILGDAAEYEVLEQAGIHSATAVVVTTHDDDMNVYLTIYCRRLRSDIQILSRSNEERNVSTLHRAGADFVLSYASIGSNALFNLLQRMDTLLLAEGLTAFRVSVPKSLIGKTIQESALREKTGCSVVALNHKETLQINPNAQTILPEDAELIIMGDANGEAKFMEKFSFHSLQHLSKKNNSM
jgi:voltage-gated potassium channel